MNRHLASRFTVGLALATLVGTSAFAEDRPSNETRRGRDTIRRERAADRSEMRRSDNSSNRRGDVRQHDRNRSESRSSGRDASYRDRSRDSRSDGRDASYRDRSRDSRPDGNRSGDNRSYDNRSNNNRSNNNRSNNNRSNNNRSYGNRSYNRQPYYAHGRVSHVSPYRGGFRVWIGGAPYPFFVPSAYYHRNRFRIGLDIRLGGYYNPLGYYDYYSGYNDNRYYDNRSYSSAELRGVVESVDYRRDTFVVRNEASGSFVTVEMRDRRRDVRAGDYVELEGEWTRSGLFRAYDVNLLDNGYRR